MDVNGIDLEYCAGCGQNFSLGNMQAHRVFGCDPGARQRHQARAAADEHARRVADKIGRAPRWASKMSEATPRRFVRSGTTGEAAVLRYLPEPSPLGQICGWVSVFAEGQTIPMQSWPVWRGKRGIRFAVVDAIDYLARFGYTESSAAGTR